MPLSSGIIYLKELNRKSLCTLITRISNISWQLMCWIDFKLDGHYLCLNFSSWLLTVQGDNKGNKMCYPIVHTSHLRRGMPLMINNLTPFSNPKTLNFNNYQYFLRTRPSFSVFVKIYSMILLSQLLKIIGRTLLVTLTNLNFVMVYCIVTNFYTAWRPYMTSNSLCQTQHIGFLAILDSIRPWN
jgi:hypothetical protein